MQLPVYVTRPDGNGTTGSISFPHWLPIIAVWIFFINVIVWGISSLFVWLYLISS